MRMVPSVDDSLTYLSWALSVLLMTAALLPGRALADYAAEDHTFKIEYEQDLLTMRVQDTPLKRVLAEISIQTGIDIILEGPADSPVTADFSSLTLEDGLKRVTRDFNRAFVYGLQYPGQAKAVMQTVFLYVRAGEGLHRGAESQTIEPAEPARDAAPVAGQATLASVGDLLNVKDPEVREEVVEMLAELKDGSGIPYLAQLLLEDENDDVRVSAAGALGEFKDARAISALTQALGDQNAEVRENVVLALGEIGGEAVAAPLKDAMLDENEGVSEVATQTLEEITEADVAQQ